MKEPWPLAPVRPAEHMGMISKPSRIEEGSQTRLAYFGIILVALLM
ncbi:MAG: hypothetical protein RMI91_02630 [Gemmatales bacterium]|nr:hypothetical protein [Gemmatales bacterium]MDW7993523.1 hypothetical protein [Gemmatales bacterium]